MKTPPHDSVAHALEKRPIRWLHACISTSVVKKILAATVVSATLFCAANSRAVTINPDGFEVGGSNFPVYSVAQGQPFEQPLVYRPVVGTLQYDPDRVLAELTVMKSRGQKKIALIIWHCNCSGGVNGVTYGIDVDSSTGRLAPLQESNLATLLDDIKQIGFEELQVRFAPQSTASPTVWQSWNETVYQQNWNFLVHTRAQVETALSATSIRRLYDLGVELGGLTGGQVPAYDRRLWQDYHILGSDDSYGFSVAASPGRFTNMINNLKLTRIALPSSYAVDLSSGDEFNKLQYIKNELSALGEGSKSITIQEDRYNNADAYAQVLSAKQTLGVNVRTIMQWPFFVRDYGPEYRNYNPFPSAGVKGTIVADPAVCTIPTTSTVGTSTISWDTHSSSSGTVKLASGTVFATGVSGSKTAPWISTGWPTFSLFIGSVLSDTTAVCGVNLTGTLGALCKDQDSGPCVMRIYWSVPDTTEQVTVKLANGTVFASGGEVGYQDAPWLTSSGATFNLYAGSKLLDTLFVQHP